MQGTPAADGVETQAAVKTHHNVLDLVLESWLKDLLVLEPLRIKILRKATRIVEEETAGLSALQALPIIFAEKATGVQKGTRCDGEALVLRIVGSADALSGESLPLPWEKLQTLVERILRELPSLSRVLYDLTPKPPATIEWE